MVVQCTDIHCSTDAYHYTQVVYSVQTFIALLMLTTTHRLCTVYRHSLLY